MTASARSPACEPEHGAHLPIPQGISPVGGAPLLPKFCGRKDFKAGFIAQRGVGREKDLFAFGKVVDTYAEVTGEKDLSGSEMMMRRSAKTIAELLSRPSSSWQEGMLDICASPRAAMLWAKALEGGQATIRRLPESLDQSPMRNAGAPLTSPESNAAFRRMRAYLIANQASYRWFALLLVTLGLEIQINANKAYEATSWDDGSFFFFAADRFLMAGDGRRLGKHFGDAEKKKMVRGGVSGMLAQCMGTRLCHVADQMPTWSPFHPPW